MHDKGGDGVTVTQTQRPDLIILDVDLIIVNGVAGINRDVLTHPANHLQPARRIQRIYIYINRFDLGE